jgi:hypothetical protein
MEFLVIGLLYFALCNEEVVEEEVVVTEAKIPKEAVNVEEVMAIAEVLTKISKIQKDKE